MTTVVIADDHPLFLDGLAALLASASDIEVIGRAVAANEAIDTVNALLPDVAVLDLNMPGPGGIATIREIVRRVDAVRILVLTMYDDDSLVFEAVRAGASGYVLKGADPEEVISAVRAVAHGEAVFGAGLARRLADWFDRSTQQDPFEQLAPRARGVGADRPRRTERSDCPAPRHLAEDGPQSGVQRPHEAAGTRQEAASQRARQAGLGPSPGQRPEVGGTLGH